MGLRLGLGGWGKEWARVRGRVRNRSSAEVTER